MSRQTLSTAEIAERTPASRDRYVDFLRVASITVVVAAHWVLALVVLDGTTALGRSSIAHLVTWLLMVMPVFFAVGGFSHAKALGSAARRPYGEFVRSRAQRLLGPVMVNLGAWLGAAVVLDAAGLGGRPIDLALDKIPTPLWFIAVYLIVVALAPLMHAAHRRAGLRVLLPLIAVVAGLDWLRYTLDVAWAGPLNIVVVWLTVHQLGFAWADGTLTRRGMPLLLATVGWGAAGVLMVGTGWYPVDMQGLPGSPAANFAPPNLALLAHGFGLVGLVLVVRGPVTRWLDRPRPWAAVVTGGSVIMTVFCWHLTAVFAVQGVLLLTGWALPPAATALWWAMIPAWLLVCAVPLAILVAGLRGFERVRPVRHAVPGRVGDLLALTGVALVAAGVFVVSQVGLDGLLSATAEPVFGLALPAWAGLLPFAVGLALLGAGRRSLQPVAARAQA